MTHPAQQPKEEHKPHFPMDPATNKPRPLTGWNYEECLERLLDDGVDDLECAAILERAKILKRTALEARMKAAISEVGKRTREANIGTDWAGFFVGRVSGGVQEAVGALQDGRKVYATFLVR